MAINTLITLKDALTTFVAQHEQLKRIEFEADDHRAPKITDGDEFPMLFVAPISVQMGNAMNMHTIRIYVYERINDDRGDVWENANDTSLMLRDIKVWWNGYSDTDIMIMGEPSGEFKCDAELDNVVGYFSDFIFEIPSHGRCDVPINVIPNPTPSCADANYIVQYNNGTLIESGTIPSGGSKTINVPDIIPCLNASWELRDSTGVLIDSGTIASGGSATITAPNATVNNSDNTYSSSVVSDGTLVLPDSQLNVNSVDVGDVVSVKTIDVNLTDGVNPVTPDAVTLVGNTVTIEVPPSPLIFPYRGAEFIIDPNNADYSYSGSGATGVSVVGPQTFQTFNSTPYVSPFFDYDGVNQYLQLSASTFKNYRNAYSFHAWVNVTPVSGGTYVFLTPSTFSSGNGAFYIHYNGTTNNLILRGYNSSNVLTSYDLGDVLLGNSGVNILISVVHMFSLNITLVYVNGVSFSTIFGVDLKRETGNLTRRIARVGGLYTEHKQGFTALYDDLHGLAEIEAIFELTKTDYGY